MSGVQAASRLAAQVRGRVQGVGFRFFVVEQARRGSITGWVRNLSDGGVELVAEGAPEALHELLAGVRQGPAGARVDEVTCRWTEAQGEFPDFAAHR